MWNRRYRFTDARAHGGQKERQVQALAWVRSPRKRATVPGSSVLAAAVFPVNRKSTFSEIPKAVLQLTRTQANFIQATASSTVVTAATYQLQVTESYSLTHRSICYHVGSMLLRDAASQEYRESTQPHTRKTSQSSDLIATSSIQAHLLFLHDVLSP